MYVDNVVTGVNDEKEAYQLYLESKSVRRIKFVTNANSLQLKIDEEEGSANSPGDNWSFIGPSDESDTKATLAPA